MDDQHNSLPKVLFVDDEKGVLYAMQRLFYDDPYDILTASDGPAALELLQKTGAVQLVISDFRMPAMNGVEFLQQVMQQWPDTRRVILSGFPDSDVLLAALNEGRVHRFLVKPWDNEEVRSVVRDLLDEYHMLVNFRKGAEDLARNNRLLSRTNEQLSSILADVMANISHETLYSDASLQKKNTSTVSECKLHESLSPREREILLAIAAGHSPKAIAMDLGLSVKTVSTYKKRLNEKMGFKSDAELIRYTITNNLLP